VRLTRAIINHIGNRRDKIYSMDAIELKCIEIRKIFRITNVKTKAMTHKPW
jgi:hypothetical protein